MSLVEVRNVSKQFASGEETIRPLDGVSLSMEKGDYVSLMGASGSGKSTLLNLVAGIDRVDSGEIVVAGTDITQLSRGKLADWRAAHIGYVFQTHNLIPVLTAYENVEYPLLLERIPAAEFPESTIMGQFLRLMQKRLETADPADKPVLEEALQRGFALLNGREA